MRILCRSIEALSYFSEGTFSRLNWLVCNWYWIERFYTNACIVTPPIGLVDCVWCLPLMWQEVILYHRLFSPSGAVAVNNKKNKQSEKTLICRDCISYSGVQEFQENQCMSYLTHTLWKYCASHVRSSAPPRLLFTAAAYWFCQCETGIYARGLGCSTCFGCWESKGEGHGHTLSFIWTAVEHRGMKKGLVSLREVFHCNPAEVAYGVHCLSHRGLSSFPKTDSSARTHTHTHTLACTPQTHTQILRQPLSKPPECVSGEDWERHHRGAEVERARRSLTRGNAPLIHF